MLFSVWEEATQNEVENKQTRNKRKYFWSFLLLKRRGKQRGNLFGFLINKQKEQLSRLSKLKRTKRNQKEHANGYRKE